MIEITVILYRLPDVVAERRAKCFVARAKACKAKKMPHSDFRGGGVSGTWHILYRQPGRWGGGGYEGGTRMKAKSGCT